MKLDFAVTLLGQTLDEEAAADEKLTKIALGRVLGDGVNEEAEKASGGSRSRGASASKKASGTRRNQPGKKSSKKKAGKKSR